MVTIAPHELHISESELARALAIIQEEAARVGVEPQVTVKEFIDPEWCDEPARTMLWASIKTRIPSAEYLGLLNRIDAKLEAERLGFDDIPITFVLAPEWSLLTNS